MRNLTKLAFRRVVTVSLCLLLQIAVMVVGVMLFSDYARWFQVLMLVGAVLLTLYIVSSKVDPGYKIAWIIPILALPVFGVTLYLMFGGNRKSRRLKKRLRLVDRMMQTRLRQDRHILDHLRDEDPAAEAPVYYLASKASCPVYERTKTDYYSGGRACYGRMLKDLQNAKQSIYLEYFIIERGKMWDQILEILQKKAAQGVDVRVIYDDFGCITKLPSGYDKKLREMGIRCRRFNPFIPVVSPLLNNRDHRKFMIIDGRVGFTGGINLADEYINEIHPFGHWKDCGIRLEGDAVWSMTVMFLSMWNLIRKDDEPERLPPSHTVEARGYVQPFTDCPLDRETVSETVLLNMIARAEKSVYIMTPYLVLNSTMRSVLCVAAKSGIDVRIITPGIPDKKYVFAVTRANYDELLDAGVRIYEYAPGFIHSKVICVDMESAVVGTINMDFRSLYLHFEDGVFLYHTDSVQQITDDFADTFPMCREVNCREHLERKGIIRLAEMVLRIFSPLM